MTYHCLFFDESEVQVLTFEAELKALDAHREKLFTFKYFDKFKTKTSFAIFTYAINGTRNRIRVRSIRPPPSKIRCNSAK